MSSLVITIDDSEDDEPKNTSARVCTNLTKGIDGEQLDGMPRKGGEVNEVTLFIPENIRIQDEQPNAATYAKDTSDQGNTSGTDILDDPDDAAEFELPPEPTVDGFDDSDGAQPLAKRSKLTNKAQKRQNVEADKARRRAEREAARAARAQAAADSKEARRRAQEAQRLLSGRGADAGVRVRVDERFVAEAAAAAAEVLGVLRAAYPGRVDVARLAVPRAVEWHRTVYSPAPPDGPGLPADSAAAAREERAPLVVLAHAPAHFLAAARAGALRGEVAAARAHYGGSVRVLVVGLALALRGLPAAARRREEEVAQAGAQELLVLESAGCRLEPDPAEAAAVLARLTRAIAEAPYRPAPSAVDLHRDAAGAGAGAKEHGGAGAGPSESWARVLQAIPGLGRNAAKAVTRRYPTMRALLDRYRNPQLSESDRAGLLQELEMEGGSQSCRAVQRLGPARSRRIYLALTTNDPGLNFGALSESNPEPLPAARRRPAPAAR